MHNHKSMPYRDETERIFANEYRYAPKVRDKMIDNHRKEVEHIRKTDPKVDKMYKDAAKHQTKNTFYL